MKHLLSLILNIVIGLSFSMGASAASKKKVKLQTALRALSGHHDQESIITLLKSKISYEDYLYIYKHYKNNISQSKKKNPYKLIGKHKLLINGKSKISFRMNGKEVLYKSIGFRLNPIWSMRRNIEEVTKRLMKSPGLNVRHFFVEPAYADSEDERKRAEVDAQFLVTALTYANQYMRWENREFRFGAGIAKDNWLHTAVSSLGPISKMECSNMGAESDGVRPGTMKISYSDGGSIQVNKMILSGGKEAYQVVNTVDNWPTHINIPVENAFEIADAVRTFCNFDEQGRQLYVNTFQDIQKENGYVPSKSSL